MKVDDFYLLIDGKAVKCQTAQPRCGACWFPDFEFRHFLDDDFLDISGWYRSVFVYGMISPTGRVLRIVHDVTLNQGGRKKEIREGKTWGLVLGYPGRNTLNTSGEVVNGFAWIANNNWRKSLDEDPFNLAKWCAYTDWLAERNQPIREQDARSVINILEKA